MRTLSLVYLLAFSACFKPADPSGTAGGGAMGTAGGSATAGGVATAGGTAGSATAGGGTTASEFVSLSLQPAFVRLPIGTSAAVHLVAERADGSTADVTSTATLSSEPLGLLELSGGTVKALAAGNARLTARLGELQAAGVVEVPSAALTSLALEPAQASLGLGQSMRLTVLGTLADASVIDLTRAATFTVTGAALSVDAAGFAHALSAGDSVITARVGALSTTGTFTVRAAAITALAVEPRTPSLAIGATQALRAIATYSDGTTAPVDAVWSSGSPAVSVSPSGVALAVSGGVALVTASAGGTSGTAEVTVRPATLVAVTVLPATLTLPPRITSELTAQARWSDGATSDITAQAQWSSSAPAVVAVTAGEVSSLGAGSAVITARLANVQGTAQLTVTPAMLVALAIRPPAPTVRPNGGTVQLSVEGRYSDDSLVDLTAHATWSSADPTLATVGNAGFGGLVRGGAPGTVMVRAALGAIGTSVSVSVVRPSPDSIEVAPANQTVEAGASLSLRAMAHYPDGAIEDVSELCTWSATPAAIATVSNTAGSKGRARGVTDGVATVRAVLGMLSASTTLTVSPPTLAQLSVFPPTLRTASGIYSRVDSTATFSDGSGGNVTGQSQWVSSNPAVARVMVYQQYYAYVEAVSPGTATITASAAGLSASLTVTVTSAALTS
ncbi:MAG: Ig-like domain-containing protein, partial [Myxococcaceae bacterium]|nr:Ig-like domain-containing protein [Myxococcaceae bacterium]